MLNMLFFFCLSALIVGSVPLWRNVIINWRRTGAPMVVRPVSESPFGMLDVVLMFFFWLAGQAVSMVVITALLGIRIEDLGAASGDTKSWAAILMAGSQLVATLLAVGVFYVRYRKLIVIGWQPGNIASDVVLGLVAFVMVIPAILFFQWLLVLVMAYKHPTMELLAKNANGLTLLATWFSAVLVAPICEEIFFRGVLQTWLQRLSSRGASDQVLIGGWSSLGESPNVLASRNDAKMGKENAVSTASLNPYQAPRQGLAVGPREKSPADSVWPIVVTSLLFGLAHVGQGPAPLTLFLFGIALGYLYRYTGSIVGCIVLHMMLNAFSMFWFTLQVFFGGTAPEAAQQVHAALAAW